MPSNDKHVKQTVISIKCNKRFPNGDELWYVTHDGHILGDSRGYNRKGAEADAKNQVANEERWSKRDNRPCEMIYKEPNTDTAASDKCEITFKAKVQSVYNMDDTLAWQYVKVPKIAQIHVVDKQSFRNDSKWRGIANSDLFLSGLARAVKALGVGENIRLDKIPPRVTIDTKGFLAVITIDLTTHMDTATFHKKVKPTELMCKFWNNQEKHYKSGGDNFELRADMLTHKTEDVAMNKNDERITKAIKCYMKHLKTAHKNDKKKYKYPESEIPRVVKTMIVNLAKGTANVDSPVARAVAEELGFGGNRSEWQHYLQSEHSLDTFKLGQLMSDSAALIPAKDHITIPSSKVGGLSAKLDTAEFGKRVREGVAHVADKVAQGVNAGAESVYYEAKSIPGGIKALGRDAVDYVKDLGTTLNEGLHNLGYRKSRPMGDVEELHNHMLPYTNKHAEHLNKLMSRHGYKKHATKNTWHKGKEHYAVHSTGSGHVLAKQRSL